jgi:uncharacterized protein (DUF934 family)
MATLIKLRQTIEDNWQLLEPAADGALPAVPPRGDVIVPLVIWQHRRRSLLARDGGLGIWLDGDDGPELIADDLEHFDVVAINFPKFTDGRGYSTARLLRDRHGYQREIRAIGDVQRDQLLHLSRCGFDAFVLKEGRDPRTALSAFADFSEAYQATFEQPLPLFRRRALAPPDGMEWS